MPPTSYLLITADDIVTKRLAGRSNNQSEFVLAGHRRTLRDALEPPLLADAEVVLIDLDTPEAAEDPLWSAVKFLYPLTRIIVALFTLPGHCRALQLAMTAGARGFLTKDFDHPLFFANLTEALAGAAVIPDERFFERVWGNPFHAHSESDQLIDPTTPPQPLSAREWKVVQLLTDGLTNREIAQRLCLAEKTVKNYVSVILNKLGVENRVQAAIWVHEFGFGQRSNHNGQSRKLEEKSGL
jgi:DNA-binding NarL/FixJ family response regulator